MVPIPLEAQVEDIQASRCPQVHWRSITGGQTAGDENGIHGNRPPSHAVRLLNLVQPNLTPRAQTPYTQIDQHTRSTAASRPYHCYRCIQKNISSRASSSVSCNPSSGQYRKKSITQLPETDHHTSITDGHSTKPSISISSSKT